MSVMTTNPTAARRLRAKLDPVMREAAARTQLLANAEPATQAYAGMLRLIYSEIRASVPLLETAEREAVARTAGDPVAAGIIEWLHQHATEEAHHDEWLLDDYTAIGGDPSELTADPGSPTIAAMVGSVYYWVRHAHPVAMLGYCAVLEGAPPSTEFIRQLQDRTGYPAEAFNTLREHSDLDIGHAAELFELIDRLPLTAEHEAIIGMTALQTADLFIAAADELLQQLNPDPFST